ncbi:hypothetical protein D3C78_840600 [compost metagenome]
MVILRNIIPCRTKTVAVQYSADLHAIGKAERRRPVPRLHQRAVIFIERLALIAHALMVRPRLRHHHQRGMRHRAAGQEQKLQRIIEHRRI